MGKFGPVPKSACWRFHQFWLVRWCFPWFWLVRCLWLCSYTSRKNPNKANLASVSQSHGLLWYLWMKKYGDRECTPNLLFIFWSKSVLMSIDSFETCLVFWAFLLSYCFCFSAPNFFPSSQSLRNQYSLFQEFPRGPFRCPPWIPFFLRFSRAAITILAKRFPLHPCPPQRLTFRQVPKPLKNFICKG